MAETLARLLLNFFIVIMLHNSFMVTEALQKTPVLSEILENMKTLPSSLMEIEEIPEPKFFTKFEEPLYINQQYTKLNQHKQSNDIEVNQLMTLYKFANLSTRSNPKDLPDCLNIFLDKIIPEYETYLRHLPTLSAANYKRCIKVNGKSFNYIIYHSFQYIRSIIRKGYYVILQSYVIRDAFEEGVDTLMHVFEKKYETTVKGIVRVFKDLAIGASTRIAACEPFSHSRKKTYLEMEKFLQGIFPQEITLNKWNSGKGTCTDYKDQGTAYYPYETIKHDGDWRCHGLMYNCFQLPQAIDICKPLNPNRRVDGIAYNQCYDDPCSKINELIYMGHCYHQRKWTLFDWRYPMPFSFYELEQCACICDDFDHPRTLRKFSREYAMSDYKNNMVVTGIRLVNISNVIHIQIREGKLEEFGFINSSTVQWRLKNNIVNRSTIIDSRSSDEVVTLSYHKRRVNLDVFYFTPNDVVIGAAFDWTREMDGVELTVFVTTFSFSTGELNQDYRRRMAPNGWREEIVLETPDMPEVCLNNVPVEGDNKFIKFQTTDWLKDAAQTTVPYLDIQEVVTNPPIMLRGVGLYYKNRHDCGGYIGLELHSRHFDDLII